MENEKLKNALLLVGLLEKFDAERAPSQPQLFHALSAARREDADARKPISQLLSNFQSLFAKEAGAFRLCQTKRRKYYLAFGSDDCDSEEGRDRLLDVTLSSLTQPRVLLQGVSRGSELAFRGGFADYLENASIGARTYLFCATALAIERGGMLEMELSPTWFDISPKTPEAVRRRFLHAVQQGRVWMEPSSLMLVDPFLLRGHVNLERTRPLELVIPLRDVVDADWLLPGDCGQI